MSGGHWKNSRKGLLQKYIVVQKIESFSQGSCKVLAFFFFKYRNICEVLKLLSAIFYQIFISHQMIALQKL